jgi:hemin uptake protein HemP
MAANENDRRPQRASSAGSHNRAVQRLQLDELLQGSQEAVIVHNGEDYRLRITSNGKLILTK